MSRKCIIGVDLGTTGIKTGIFNSTRRLMSGAYEESIHFSSLTCYPILDIELSGMPTPTYQPYIE